MPFTPSSIAQAIAVAAGNNMAALAAPLTAMQTSIAGGNLSPAALFDGLQTFTTWVEIGSGGGAPAFTNSWVNNGGGFDTAAYLRDALGFVHLKGLIQSGVMGSAAFTLPAGFRPALVKLFPSISNSLIGGVNIGTNGDVIPSVGTNAYIALDGIIFKAN